MQDALCVNAFAILSIAFRIFSFSIIFVRGRRRSHYFMWFVAGFGPVAPSFGLSGRWAFSGTFSHQVPDIAENDPWYLCAGGRRAESYHRRRPHFDARNFHCSDLTSAPLLVDEFDRYQSNWTAQVCLRINLTSSSHTLHWLSLRMLAQHLRHLTHLTPQTTPL